VAGKTKKTEKEKEKIGIMNPILDKIKYFFSEQPLPHSALHVSSRYLSGIRVSPNDRKLKHHFVLPFPEDVIVSSFHKKNIKDSAALEKIAAQGLAKLHLIDHKVVLLLPELSQKTFVFSFDSMPVSPKEREQIILFRIKKQIPILPKDTRLSYSVIKSNAKKRVLATIARSAVVEEYEEVFSRLRLKVRVVGVPSLNLYNLIDSEKDKDFILVDLERDVFSLLAITNSEISFYRQKPVTEGFSDQEESMDKWMDIVQEVENTAQFVENKEQRKIKCLWVRTGEFGSVEGILSSLEDRCQCPVKAIEMSLKSNLPLEEKRLLAPLFGQLS
jgi:Tfp pilus assembly PilM family ATPase